MKRPTFEIKIAFCGHVNSGKSTLVNALLQQKYSEVSMNRSTFGVNFFRVFSNQDKSFRNMDEVDSISSNITKESDTEVVTTWSFVPEKLHSAAETHRAIAEANAALCGRTMIKEATFDIDVPEAICDLREDTQLVVVDLPGFTHGQSDRLYLNYLNANWDSFDCVVVVMDVMEYICDHLKLLNLVKENLNKKKDIPVIFVCNKVDSPHNAEVNVKLEELECNVREIFSPECVFISLCAHDALIYRAASGLSFDQFKQIDMEWIDKIGIDEVSRSKWRQLSPKEKAEVAHKVVSSKTLYDESLAATNFPKFLMAVKDAVGGSSVQLKLIQKQLEVALKAVQAFDETTVLSISKIKCISERLDITTELAFNDHFWTTYKNYMEGAIESYKLTTDHKVFHVAMSQLIAYDAELRKSDFHKTERVRVVDEMVSLVRSQLSVLLKYAESWQGRYLDQKTTIDKYVYYECKDRLWRYASDDADLIQRPYIGKVIDEAHFWQRNSAETWTNRFTLKVCTSKYNPVSKKSDWYDLSLRDFEIALCSILFLSSCKPFWLHFGKEKMRMESLLRKFDCLREMYINDPSESKYRCMFRSIDGSYDDDGKYVPTSMDLYNVFVHFKMPEQIPDPEHWGHLAWKFCEFKEKFSN